MGDLIQYCLYCFLRLFEELKDFFHLELTVPSSDSHLVRDLSTWLKMAASRTKCYIVLDAVNQLDDGTGTEGKRNSDLVRLIFDHEGFQMFPDPIA